MTKLPIFFLLTLLVSCGKPLTNQQAPGVNKNLLSKSSDLPTVELLGSQMIANFDQLPMQGEITDQSKYWSGDYWQHNKGSINLRWYTPEPVGFDYRSPAKDEVATMGTENLKALAPSEKYDLLMGRYDYPLKKEVAKIARKNAKDWEGLCHGWAPASLNHREPEPKYLVNPQGIEIPFGSSDIKALLTYYYAYHSGGKSFQVGKRCYSERPGGEATVVEDTDKCNDDLDPALFHIVLANKIGLEGVSFLADIERYKEVWNHPIVTYTSSIVSEKVKRKIRTLEISTKIYYVDEKDLNFWSPTIGSNEHITTQKVYNYLLEVDRTGKILKGKWLSEDRPDFLWTLGRPEQFEGYFVQLKSLIAE